MKARFILVTLLLGMLAGCVDTADSVSREYRNQINEGLDAMMLVTDESSANQLTLRIFKPMGDRFKMIEHRTKVVSDNRTKKEFALEFGLSNGVDMLVSEIFVNRERFKSELARIDRLTKREIERAEKNPPAEGDACAALKKIADKSVLLSLENELKSPKIFQMLNEIKGWGGLEKVVGKDDVEKLQKRKWLVIAPLGNLK